MWSKRNIKSRMAVGISPILVIPTLLAAFCVSAKAQCPQFEDGLQVGTVAHSLLDEISGIAASRQNSDVLWVHNDKGGEPRVFAMNPEGSHLGIYNLSGAINYDWEDIAIGPGPVDDVDYLYVGDIGDNDGSRPYIRVFRVAEPVVDSNQSPIETTLTGVDTITLVYPDGARDAEALMIDSVTKDIYIISKDDSFSRVYRAPYPQSTTTTTVMEYKCELPWNKASGGDISPDGDMVIVKTGESSNNRASIWLRPAGTNLWDAFSGNECTVGFMFELNGEAVCFDGDGCGYYTTSEGLHQPIYYFASVNTKLSVTEIMSSSGHSGGTDADWWELTYSGSSSVDLNGYSWDDDHERVGQNVFGSVTIGPNESIIIINEDSNDVNAWKDEWSLGTEVGVYGLDYFSFSFSGLGSSDGVFLYEPSGGLVTSVLYPSRTTGFSNEWDTNGTFLGLSVIGENGAYQSLNSNPDVGSPGYAVIIIQTEPKTIYVDGDANGLNDGSSWEDAYNFLQDALDEAVNGDEIWVANGTYYPTAQVGGVGERYRTFQMKNGVAIRGGYTGYGAPDPNERDIELYETILSGDIGVPGDNNDNCYRVLYHPNGTDLDSSAILDGFTITAGNGSGGGGMCNRGSSPTITNCVFSENSGYWGGGMCNWDNSSPTITNCTFNENMGSFGGGMCNWDNSSPTLVNCKFSGNSADCGGGMYNWDDNTTLTNCIFSGNSALNGGGIYISYSSNVALNNCTFSENVADEGGGIFLAPIPVPAGGPLSIWDAGVVTCTNCIFWGNMDKYGRSESAQIYIHFTNDPPVVNYCCIEGLTGALGGMGNIDANPCFVDEANGDYHLKSAGWRWDRQREMWKWDEVTSPCIDTGNPGSPLGEELLFVPDDPNNKWGENLRINMGAYGGTAEASMARPGWPLLADLNNDEIVNFLDFAGQVQDWMTTENEQPGDLNRDGVIDRRDLAILAEGWLKHKSFGVSITKPEDGAGFSEWETIEIEADA